MKIRHCYILFLCRWPPRAAVLQKCIETTAYLQVVFCAACPGAAVRIRRYSPAGPVVRRT